jgi:hypothetical protein
MVMKPWDALKHENPELAMIGRRLLFQSQPHVGFAFLATLRKDGAPRLHPVSIILFNDHLYVMIPTTSPKCADLLRDGRFAMQAFPPQDNESYEEFYLSGCAITIDAISIHKALISDTQIRVGENEALFELHLDRVMYTRLINQGAPDEQPMHQKWHAEGASEDHSKIPDG